MTNRQDDVRTGEDCPDDICPRIDSILESPTRPAAVPIYPASVYACDSPQQAYDILEGHQPGYVYQRSRHPNADVFSEKVRQLHGAEQCVVTSAGMAALVAVVTSQLQAGDHILFSNHLYGESALLLRQEVTRFGIQSTSVDTCDPQATSDAFTNDTKLVVAETIANPLLRVTDISALAELCHTRGAKLLIDNTFATPALCRPLSLGADFVMESVSKLMNGHSDVMLGVLCGHAADWERVPRVVAMWGLASSPWDCWLAARGLATMHLRAGRASENALAAAQFLQQQPQVTGVEYPGLASHREHDLAGRQLRGGFGNMVAFHLAGDRAAADKFIQAARQIPFCPSLGETYTTLSHPQSTSHRSLTEKERQALGIQGGTIRLSVGIESPDFVRQSLEQGLAALK